MGHYQNTVCIREYYLFQTGFFFLVWLLHEFFNAEGKRWWLSFHVLSLLPCNIFLFHFLFIDFYFLLFQIYSTVVFLLILLVFQCRLQPVTQPLFISCTANLKCHWKLKKKENCCLIWSVLFRFIFLALWLSFHWLPFPALPASPEVNLIIDVHVINILNKWDNPSILTRFQKCSYCMSQKCHIDGLDGQAQ